MLLYVFLKIIEAVKGWLYMPRQQVEVRHEPEAEEEEEVEEPQGEPQEEPVKRYNLRERKLVDYQD